MTTTQNNYPCWLNKYQLEQAEALIKLGFVYIGTEEPDEIGFYTKYKQWEFYTCLGECNLEAICNEACYLWCLENHKDIDSKNFLEARLKECIQAIKSVKKASEDCNQLTLF